MNALACNMPWDNYAPFSLLLWFHRFQDMYVCMCVFLFACVWVETINVNLPVSPLLWGSQKTTFKSWFWPYALLNQDLCSFCSCIVYFQLSFSYPLCVFHLITEVLGFSVILALPQTYVGTGYPSQQILYQLSYDFCPLSLLFSFLYC